MGKKLRLPNYDYSQNGAYFITFCTWHRECLLARVGHAGAFRLAHGDEFNLRGGDEFNVGRDDLGAPALELTDYGRIVERYIRSIPNAYPNVELSNYVVMPNHVHLLLLVSGDGAPGSSRPTDMGMPRATQLIPRIVAALKRFSNRDAGVDLWQSSYHDHVVRSETEFLEIWNYIEGNPSQWSDDIYYER